MSSRCSRPSSSTQARGHRFDSALLTIEPIATPDHEGRALSADQLEFLVAHAPSYVFRLVLLDGTTGNRINELFTLTEDRVNLARRTLTIPAELCKERRRKVIPLTPEKVRLLRAQLVARAPGTHLVFPKKHGSQWAYSAFRKLVMLPMIRDTADAWKREREAPEPSRASPAIPAPYGRHPHARGRYPGRARR